MKKVIGLGAGGHAKMLIEIIQAVNGYEIVGLVDPNPALLHTQISGINIIGDDTMLPKLYNQGIKYAFIGLGAVENSLPRQRLYSKAKQQGFTIISALHPRAVISPSSEMGEGVTVMPGAIINVAVQVGENVIINTGAIVEHDCVIGDHVHIATGARLAGAVSVSTGAFIGAGATVIQGVTIGRNSVVGAGAVVVEDVPDNVVVVGVPARITKKKNDAYAAQ